MFFDYLQKEKKMESFLYLWRKYNKIMKIVSTTVGVVVFLMINFLLCWTCSFFLDRRDCPPDIETGKLLFVVSFFSVFFWILTQTFNTVAWWKHDSICPNCYRIGNQAVYAKKKQHKSWEDHGSSCIHGDPYWACSAGCSDNVPEYKFFLKTTITTTYRCLFCGKEFSLDEKSQEGISKQEYESSTAPGEIFPSYLNCN